MPIAAAPAPRTTKTTVKPRMNGTLATHDAPRRAALAEPPRLDARERREVAGDERQHARRDHRREARENAIGEPARPSVEACQQLVEPPLGLVVEPGAAGRRLVGSARRGSSARRRRRRTSAPRDHAADRQPPREQVEALVRRRREDPRAEVRDERPPRSAASSQHASIRCGMKTSIRCAAGESDWSSVVWQVGHMTSPSRRSARCADAHTPQRAPRGRAPPRARRRPRRITSRAPPATPRWNASFWCGDRAR